MLKFEALWPLLEQHAQPLEVTRAPLADAAWRTLAAPARAAWDLPRFDNSAMDGYAVRYTDVATASPERPVTLKIIGDAFAGPAGDITVAPGTAARIGTGGLLPNSADTIIAREDTRANSNDVTILATPKQHQHIRRQGEELKAGGDVLPAGARLTPVAVATLQAAGVTTVDIYRAPCVAVLATGDELVAAGQTPGPGQIVETNGQMIAAALAQRLNIAATRAHIVADDLRTTKVALAKAWERTDVVITTGGVSVGDHDFVKDAAEALGAERLVWQVAMKPGKPLYIAKRGQQWIVGLPGNPASTAVAIVVTLLPLLSGLGGKFERPLLVPVQLASPVRHAGKRTDFRWVKLHRDGAGLLAEPLTRTGSHMLSELAMADALALVPPGEGSTAPDLILDAILLNA